MYYDTVLIGNTRNRHKKNDVGEKIFTSEPKCS